MKKLVITKISACILILFAVLILPSKNAYAATSHNITYVDVNGSSISSSVTITDGDSIGTLPVVQNLIAWVDSENRIVTSSTIPTSDLRLTAITTTDVSANGTMDSGNIVWYILNEKLIVTGNGTISIANRASTGAEKNYGMSLNSIELTYPSIKEEWILPSNIADEQAPAFGAYTAPSTQTYNVDLSISRPVSFTNQSISYPATALADAAPWLASASEITEIIFTDTVSLSGNFTLYFNQNSSVVTPSELKESVYTNLETIYMFADTSNVTRMSGMYARCPKLKNVFTKQGSSYNTQSCVDLSAVFYGDELLVCTDNSNYWSVINHFSNTSSVKDLRYAFFDCKSLVTPAIGSWDVSNVEDFSYMFTGCNNAKLTCGATLNDSDLQNWNMENAYSTVCMFSGADIDITQANPVADLWGETSSSVVIGAFDLSKWNLSKLQVAVYMFAQNSSLENVIWSGDVPLLTDASAMFAWNSGLETVTFTGLNTPRLQYCDTMFFSSGTDSSTAEFDGWVLSALNSANYMFYGSKFEVIDFDNTNPSLLKSATGMFEHCENLSSLGNDALSSWRLADLENADYMFESDKNLLKLNVANWGLDNVKTLAYFIADCSSLEALNTSNWNISNSLVDLSCFSYGASKISSLDMHMWDISGVKNGFYAFGKMFALQTVNIAGWNPASLSNAYGMFAYDYSLQKMDWGDAVAPDLENASGMYITNISMVSLSLPKLITSSADNLSYFASGCSNILELDISGWDTHQAKYMQYMLNGLVNVTDISFGANFSTESALSVANILKNNANLSNTSLQSFLTNFKTDSLINAYEMLYNCANLTHAEIGSLDFSSVENISGMFYKDDLLTVINLPESFGINAANKENVFYCDTETLTYLTVNSDTLPDFVANYDWDADNRIFLLSGNSSINNVSGNTYKFIAGGDTSVQLEFDAVPTLYLKSTPLNVLYTWAYGVTPLSVTANTYTAPRSSVGSYTCTARLAGINSEQTISTSFTLTKDSGITGLTAIYKGSEIPVGNNYSKKDLLVTVQNSSGGNVVLDEDDYTVSSTLVAKNGTNTFTAHYEDASGVPYSATFTVPGIRVVSSITATYYGPDVIVGKNFDSAYVTVTAYYADDVYKTEGFSVKATSFNSQQVNYSGANNFIAYYKEPSTGTTLSAVFYVNGYEKSNISSISANYGGSDISVGKEYSLSDVTVTINYSDGSPSIVASSFTVNTQLVSQLGSNSFTAYYTAPNGVTYTADFTVKGVETVSVSANTKATSAATTAGSLGVKTGDSSKILGTVLIIIGFSLVFGILLYLKYRKKRADI